MFEPEIAAAEAMEASALNDPDSVDLNGEPTQSRLARALGRLPYLLSSRIVFLFGIENCAFTRGRSSPRLCGNEIDS